MDELNTLIGLGIIGIIVVVLITASETISDFFVTHSKNHRSQAALKTHVESFTRLIPLIHDVEDRYDSGDLTPTYLSLARERQRYFVVHGHGEDSRLFELSAVLSFAEGDSKFADVMLHEAMDASNFAGFVSRLGKNWDKKR